VWAGKLSPSEPELLTHRTNLDTAAYATGVLTIAVFQADRAGGPIECISVRGEAALHMFE
jgi:serine/threonine protein phosphatase 1